MELSRKFVDQLIDNRFPHDIRDIDPSVWKDKLKSASKTPAKFVSAILDTDVRSSNPLDFDVDVAELHRRLEMSFFSFVNDLRHAVNSNSRLKFPSLNSFNSETRGKAWKTHITKSFASEHHTNQLAGCGKLFSSRHETTLGKKTHHVPLKSKQHNHHCLGSIDIVDDPFG